MANKPHTCDSCLKICDEAKQTVKSLQKKIYTLTIVCTSAITLLGEQGAKALLAAINTTTTAIKSAETKTPKETTSIEETKKEDKLPIDKSVWIMPNNSIFVNKDNIEFKKPYELVDELSRLPQPDDVVQTGIDEETLKKIIVTATKKPTTEKPILEEIQKLPINAADNHAAFFIPSLLPFDVYNATLGLGVNYGFGEYYGIENNIAAISVPQPGIILIGIIVLFLISNRKRKI